MLFIAWYIGIPLAVTAFTDWRWGLLSFVTVAFVVAVLRAYVETRE